MNKVPTSTATIRFQDCDPFNHLNNAKYLDYFINAREDQLIREYSLDVFSLAAHRGVSWVVASNQIAYFRPATVMEEIVIDSQLIKYNEKSLWVEMRMWDKEKHALKAVLWAKMTHFDFKQLKPLSHLEEFGDLFQQIVLPVEEKTFEERTRALQQKRPTALSKA